MLDTKTRLPTLSRRQFFQVGGVGVSGFFLEALARPVNVWAKEKVRPRGTGEYCIFVNLAGGASHVDTFDIKEGRWMPPAFDVRTIKPDAGLGKRAHSGAILSAGRALAQPIAHERDSIARIGDRL